MERVALDDRREETASGTTRRALSDALSTTDIAINHYRIPPSEGLPAGLHAHMDQEEVFVVIEGQATFETLEGAVTVDAGEAIRFAPGEFQSGRNAADAELHVLALGAPRDSTDVRIPISCSACGHDTLRLETDGELHFVCPGCDHESVPAPCPACDGEHLQVSHVDSDAADATVGVICQDCGATFDRPPTRD